MMITNNLFTNLNSENFKTNRVKLNFKIVAFYFFFLISIFSVLFTINLHKVYASGVSKSFTEYSLEQGYANGGSNCSGVFQGEFSWLYSGSTSNDGQSGPTTFMVSPGGQITLNTQSEDVVCDAGVVNHTPYVNDNTIDTCPFGGFGQGFYFEPFIQSISPPTCASPYTNASFPSVDTAYQYLNPSVTSGPGSVSCNSGCNPVVQIPYSSNTQVWDPSTGQPSLTYSAPLSLSTASPTAVSVTIGIYAVNEFQEFGNSPVYICVTSTNGQDVGPSSIGSPASYCSGWEYFHTFQFFVQGIAPAPTLSCVIVNTSDGGQEDTNGTWSAIVGVNVSPFNSYDWQGSATLSGAGITGLSQTQPGLDLSPGSHNLTFSGLSGSSPGTYTFDFSATSTNGGNNLSNVPCGKVVIGNEPYISVEGGNTITGADKGGVGTTLCQGTNLNAGILGYASGTSGSGDNLAALAPNIINGFNSGDGVNGYYQTTGIIPDGLTFANTVNAPWGGNFGDAGTALCTDDFYASAPTVSQPKVKHVGSGGINLDSIESTGDPSACNSQGSVLYCWYEGPSGLLNITEGGTPLTRSIVLFVNGDSLITPNIELNYISNPATSFASVSNIPSFYLIDNGDIYIDNSNPGNFGGSNPKLDGVYISQPFNPNETKGSQNNPSTNGGGHIFTCANGANNSNANPSRYNFDSPTGPFDLYNSCQNGVLTFTGAVIANQIKLERTLGNISGPSPSERFHYIPFIWMVDPFTSSATQTLNPVYQSITALPPIL